MLSKEYSLVNITYFFLTCSAQEHEPCPFRIALHNETLGVKCFLQIISDIAFYLSPKSDLNIFALFFIYFVILYHDFCLHLICIQFY